MNPANLIAPVALLLAADAAAQPGQPAAPAQECLQHLESDPARAYEEAMARAALTQEVEAFRCAAMALAAQNRWEEAARRFDGLAAALSSETPVLRIELLSQAGNAWIAARDPVQARAALTRALDAARGATALNTTHTADLLIDRARAFALETEWRQSEEDLSRALDLRPQDALALRLRAYARMQQNAFDLAESDAAAAVALEPTNVDALLMLGHAREAKRTGAPIEAP